MLSGEVMRSESSSTDREEPIGRMFLEDEDLIKEQKRRRKNRNVFVIVIDMLSCLKNGWKKKKKKFNFTYAFLSLLCFSY